MTARRDYASYSFWLETCGDDLTPRPRMPHDTDVDVAIVGAGYTGLWTAYYLAKGEPGLRIAIAEKDIAGFGASGRNGGWCSALFAASKEKIAKAAGRDAAIAMQRAMCATIDEIGGVCKAEGIDAHFLKSGTLSLATQASHVQRIKDEVESENRWGSAGACWLDAAQARQRIDCAGLLGAAFTPDCAVVHPARLARGLARVVEALGVPIYEQTPVIEIGDHRIRTATGTMRADAIVRATEGYTPQLPGHGRTLVPLYSLMIVTEPLPDAAWDAIGWGGRETVHDGRHLLIYAQRTTDGRIAIGGRGAPYHFGSRISDAYDRDDTVFTELRTVLVSLFPILRDVRITHRWGGCLGVPRDWHSSVGFDRSTGLGWAGGYVGDGVSTTNLAGRTLADLIGGRQSELTTLPWVNHRSRAWEPEPLRWIGINSMLKVAGSADKVEARTGRAARRGELVKRLAGR